jgi:hypothetical protein
MRYYKHTSPNCVISYDGKSAYCRYEEVIDGTMCYDTVEVEDWHRARFGNEWIPISKEEANKILGIPIESPPKIVDLSECFTTIDIHMFSSGEANEL